MLTTAHSHLIQPVNYRLNIALSFKANGAPTTQLVSAPLITFVPAPALKLFYFVHRTLDPATPQPFSVLVSLINAMPDMQI